MAPAPFSPPRILACKYSRTIWRAWAGVGEARARSERYAFIAARTPWPPRAQDRARVPPPVATWGCRSGRLDVPVYPPSGRPDVGGAVLSGTSANRHPAAGRSGRATPFLASRRMRVVQRPDL